MSKNPLNSFDYDERTPLLISMEYENNEISLLLIESGTNVNLKLTGGVTYLEIAEDINVIKKLIDFGAKVTQEALINAIELNNFGKIEILVRSGVSTGGPMFQAFEDGNFKLMDLMLHNGALIDETEGNSETLLEHALLYNLGNIDFLLERGANINKVDRNGDTFLSGVIKANNEPEITMEVVKLTVQNGGNVNYQYKDGISLLQLAIKSENDELIEFLESVGAV